MPKVSAPQSNPPEKAPAKTAKPQAKPAAVAPPKAQAPKTSWVHTAPTAAPARPKKADGFQSINPETRKQTSAPRASDQAVPTSGLGKLLQDAQEPGKYFKPRKRGSGGGETQTGDDELATAVTEARKLLTGVTGIGEIGPGENDAGEPVVLIAADRGFTDVSMRAIPWHVGRFATLVALPYELLPLKQG